MVENKPLYVLDASVILKWIFDNEHDSKIAFEILNLLGENKISVAVPINCFVEVINVLGVKKYENALDFLSKLLCLNIDQYDFTLKIASLAWKIVQDHKGVAFYDALYHVLAVQLGAIFVTADEKYYQKAKSLKHVMLLRDYKSSVLVSN